MANESQAAGIDVSHFQGTVNWTEVAASGIVFAFAKATDGITYTDPEFSVNWPAMKSAGLLRGAYHFYEPADDPVSQAEHFLSTVSLVPGDLPPVLDVETLGASAAELWSGVATWLQTVQTATGRQPILYLAPDFWNDNSPDLALASYPLWLADYASQPTLPNGWSAWTFWQHSETGSVPGVSNAVDLDLFNGTVAQLREWVGLATPSTTVPATVSATATTTAASHLWRQSNRRA